MLQSHYELREVITFYHHGGASVGKVDVFAISALTLVLPSGVLDILNKESPQKNVHSQERYNYGAGLSITREKSKESGETLSKASPWGCSFEFSRKKEKLGGLHG